MITYDYLGLWTLRVVTCAQRLDMLRTISLWLEMIFHCVDSVELLYCSCEDSDLSGNVFDVTLNQSSYFESHLFKNPTLLHWIFFWSLLHRPLGTVHRGKAYVARPQDVRHLHRRQAELEDALSTARPGAMWPGAIAGARRSDIEKNRPRGSLWCSGTCTGSAQEIHRHSTPRSLQQRSSYLQLIAGPVWEKRWHLGRHRSFKPLYMPMLLSSFIILYQ